MDQFIIQIYEIQTPDEAETLIDLGVDHIGSVVLSEASWKDPVLKETVTLVDSSTAKSSLIPLFSDPDTIYRVLDYYCPDMVHFCENLAACSDTGKLDNLIACQKNIGKRFPDIQIMRSIPVPTSVSTGDDQVLQFAHEFSPVSDFFLTDTLRANTSESSGEDQPVAGFVGITGETCDWGVSAELVRVAKKPVLLAGGLSPENVFDGILAVRPAGVDSCTRTNVVDSDGRVMRFKKDMNRVKRFIQETRRAFKFLSDSCELRK